MTDQQQPRPDVPRDQSPPPDAEAVDGPSASPEDGGRPALGDTVGTGTSLALGCVLGTVAIVLIGLLFLVLLMILG